MASATRNNNVGGGNPWIFKRYCTETHCKLETKCCVCGFILKKMYFVYFIVKSMIEKWSNLNAFPLEFAKMMHHEIVKIIQLHLETAQCMTMRFDEIAILKTFVDNEKSFYDSLDYPEQIAYMQYVGTMNAIDTLENEPVVEEQEAPALPQAQQQQNQQQQRSVNYIPAGAESDPGVVGSNAYYNRQSDDPRRTERNRRHRHNYQANRRRRRLEGLWSMQQQLAAGRALWEDFGDLPDLNVRSGLSGQQNQSKKAMTDADRKTLTVYKFSKKDIASEKLDACGICRRDCKLNERKANLKCHKYFHASCIIPWLELKDECPLCRAPVLTKITDFERERAKHIYSTKNATRNQWRQKSKAEREEILSHRKK